MQKLNESRVGFNGGRGRHLIDILLAGITNAALKTNRYLSVGMQQFNLVLYFTTSNKIIEHYCSNKQQQMMDPEEAAAVHEEPFSKKLRYSHSDLKIVLKFKKENEENSHEESGIGADEEGNESGCGDEEWKEKEYEMYSQSLAQMSDFVDAALSVDMKEKETKKIVFHDVTPKVFEKALEILQDPLTAMDMTATDALQIVDFYHRYEFAKGVKLCDRVLHDNARRDSKNLDTSDKLDRLVDICLVADKLDLKVTRPAIFECLHGIARTQFRREHIARLQPFILSEELNRLHTFLYGKLMMDGEDLAVLKSPLLPNLCVQYIRNDADRPNLNLLALNGATKKANGQYFGNEEGYCVLRDDTPVTDTINDMEMEIVIERDIIIGHGDWAIIGRPFLEDDWSNDPNDDVVLWKCPNSSNFFYPPKESWVPVHAYAGDSRPKIEYLSFHHDGQHLRVL